MRELRDLQGNAARHDDDAVTVADNHVAGLHQDAADDHRLPKK